MRIWIRPLKKLVTAKKTIQWKPLCILALAAILWGSWKYACGPSRPAMEFDGVDDYLLCDDEPSLDVTDQITVEAWVKGRFADGAQHTIIRKGNAYYLGVANHRLNGAINTTNWKTVQARAVLTDDRWHHLAMTYSRFEPAPKATTLDNFNGLRMDGDAPAVRCGAAGEFDEHIREIGNVLCEPDEADPGKKYKIFYSGYHGTYKGNNVGIGYAYSADGKTWTKRPNKIIDRPLEDPYVVNNDGTYYLFAEDKADMPFRNIRRYHSPDCLNWADDGDVFDVRAGGDPVDWEAQDVSSPVVWIENNIWYLLYEGRGGGYWGKIGLATSHDGVHWTRYKNNPVFDCGPPGNWDETNVVCDDIIKVGARYYMTYHGYGASGPTGYWSGLAYCDDLHNWVRHSDNPFSICPTVMFLYDTEYVLFCEDIGGVFRSNPCIVSAPRLYIDGLEQHYLIRQDCDNAPITADDHPVSIGKSPVGIPYFFRGSISRLRIWGQALSPREIRWAMDGVLAENEPNLAACWEFDQGGG
jgi:predicted GH43/DUF377 family glycosyl hydrolase